MIAVDDATPTLGAAPACRVLGLSRASLYRGRRPAAVARPRPAPPRALDPVERQSVLDLLHTRFIDQAPAQVHATLLDEGTYLCSPRTMYRVLDAAHEIKERRNQVRRPHYAAPELLATRPNAVWSWDITKLRGPATWTYFYLYVILDIFSRYVVGWMIAPRESAVLAERLIADTCAKHGIHPGQLTLHADRGTSMKSKPVALLLADLGVTKTHSRPHVSNDNPFSGSSYECVHDSGGGGPTTQRRKLRTWSWSCRDLTGERPWVDGRLRGPRSWWGACSEASDPTAKCSTERLYGPTGRGNCGHRPRLSPTIASPKDLDLGRRFIHGNRQTTLEKSAVAWTGLPRPNLLSDTRQFDNLPSPS